MRTMALLLCALMLTSSVAIAHQVKTDYDRSAQFYKYTTFMWIKEPQLASFLTNEQIIEAVNAELQARGLYLVTSDADLAVSVHSATYENRQLKFFYADLAGGWGWYRYWRPIPSITVVEIFKVGTVVVDLFDTRTQRVVWWATGTDTVTERAEKNVQHLNKAVERMFWNFPVAPKP